MKTYTPLYILLKNNRSILKSNTNTIIMSPIASLVITHVTSSAEYIAETFYRKGLATISRILLIPYSVILKTKDAQGSLAVIDIHEWHDAEIAYEFISDINNLKVVRVIHDTVANSWCVAQNKELAITTARAQRPYLTEFNCDEEEDYVTLNDRWSGTHLEKIFQMEI